MRTKTKQSLDIAAVSEAWKRLAEETSGQTEKEIESTGWYRDGGLKSKFKIGKKKLSRLFKEGKVEKRTIKTLIAAKKRPCVYYRPKL
jgi:hypothetical protein